MSTPRKQEADVSLQQKYRQYSDDILLLPNLPVRQPTMRALLEAKSVLLNFIFFLRSFS